MLHHDDHFDPTPLPHRPVYWRAAFRALAQLRHDVEGDAIDAFRLALEGDDFEHNFQDFLATEGAAGLIRTRPDLAAHLDDWSSLEVLPRESLGQRYLALARRDGIRVAEIAHSSRAAVGENERAPDAVRRWFRDRMAATHDLLHTLTGYGRDVAGEAALLAFSYGWRPLRIFRVPLLLTLLGSPSRPVLWRYYLCAWRRGRRAHVPLDLDWEALLPLPLPEVRARLEISATERVHPGGVWYGERSGRTWHLQPAR